MPKIKAKETVKRTLTEITKDLGVADATQKEAKKDRDKGRDEFFAAANDSLAQGDLARKTVNHIVASEEDEAREYAEQRNPGWKAKVSTQRGENEWSVIIEEDPAYLPFVFVNKEDEKVYSRSIAAGNLMLDDDLLSEDDPNLYEEVTQILNADVLFDFLDQFGGNSGLEEHAHEFVAANPERFPRVLRPLDDLTQEQLDAVQEYTYEGTKTLKLNAPRKAKEEELN